MNSIRTQTTGKSTIHRNVPRRSRSQEPMQRRKSDKNNHDLSIKLNQIATKKLLICAAIIAFLAPNCRAAEIDLLAKPNDWVLDGTSEGIYSIDKDRIRAKRRSNESATVPTREKIISNIQEVRARNGIVLTIATQDDTNIQEHSDMVIYVPRCMDALSPILNAIPLQLFAYYISVNRGCDVDQPRNLAKSVTVE